MLSLHPSNCSVWLHNYNSLAFSGGLTAFSVPFYCTVLFCVLSMLSLTHHTQLCLVTYQSSLWPAMSHLCLFTDQSSLWPAMSHQWLVTYQYFLWPAMFHLCLVTYQSFLWSAIPQLCLGLQRSKPLFWSLVGFLVWVSLPDCRPNLKRECSIVLL